MLRKTQGVELRNQSSASRVGEIFDLMLCMASFADAPTLLALGAASRDL